MDEVVHVFVTMASGSFGYGHKLSGDKVIYKGRTFEDDFSRDAIDKWLKEVRVLAYTPGRGTWTSAEVHVLPDRPGYIRFSNEEQLPRMSDGSWFPGGEPANATAWAQQYLAYPRTVDNIPSWMWDIFREEGVTPPIYNPEFKSVDWKNRRRPVTDRGTDFSVEPTVIGPSLEPGVLSRIGKKLFGSRS
ncbi:hypothetical protein ACIQTZ_07965 [Paenarthrobacter sp. NPDC090520]|uniref:hypothetical protein n=1 Tax=Paenarthrobacter sp. NPDC090520 TaxID=3364382 RepID=UPI00382880F1